MEEKPNIKKIVSITVIITAVLSFFATTYFYNYIVQVVPFGSLSENYPKLNNILKSLDENFYKDFDKAEFEEKIIPQVVNALGDPYTAYMGKEEWTAFNESITGKYDGIGVTVGGRAEDKFIHIISTMEQSPAFNAGIVSGDRLIKVEGEEFFVDTMDVAVSKIRGAKGTHVNITIKHADDSEADLQIIRESIQIDTVKSKMFDQIGYIQIFSFDVATDVDFKQKLDEVKAAGAKGLIIDLRNNGGGIVQSAEKIADMLLPSGVIVYAEDRNGKRRYTRSDSNELDIPIVILVNEGTASASEILSGAVKDYQKGELIGKKTFGKGLIQLPMEFKDGSALKITIEKYYTPNGNDINTLGIEPNIEVALPEGVPVVATEENDTQFAKAIEVLKQKIK